MGRGEGTGRGTWEGKGGGGEVLGEEKSVWEDGVGLRR